jgi:hypothetical protein
MSNGTYDVMSLDNPNSRHSMEFLSYNNTGFTSEINCQRLFAVRNGGPSHVAHVRPTNPTEFFLLNCICLSKPQRKRFGRDLHTGTHKVEQENDLIDKFIALKTILGRNPQFVELLDAGFIRENRSPRIHSNRG